ncbi:MAG: BrnT family toxin [Rhizonema sp. PD38]|nr:BrnT family toxin [Rhizonema sp. PD38]
MLFEWDEEKAQANLLKHRISFVAATAVFDDPNRIDEDSTKPEYGEVRTKTIGLIEGELIIVVIHTDREQKRRIISARRARKNEQEKYYHS